MTIDRAGLVGEDGPTHHGILIFPICVIFQIDDHGAERRKWLRHMHSFQIDGPVALRYPRGHGLGVALDRDLRMLPRKGELLRHGTDITCWQPVQWSR